MRLRLEESRYSRLRAMHTSRRPRATDRRLYFVEMSIIYFAVTTEFDHLNIRTYELHLIHTITYQLYSRPHKCIAIAFSPNSVLQVNSANRNAHSPRRTFSLLKVGLKPWNSYGNRDQRRNERRCPTPLVSCKGSLAANLAYYYVIRFTPI